MNDSFQWWLVIVGIGVGVGLAWIVMGRLARSDDDVSDEERRVEAAWISRSIASYGGVAPTPLVEEILELHRHYLEGPALDVPAVTDTDDALDDELMDEGEPAEDAEPRRSAQRSAPTVLGG